MTRMAIPIEYHDGKELVMNLQKRELIVFYCSARNRRHDQRCLLGPSVTLYDTSVKLKTVGLRFLDTL